MLRYFSSTAQEIHNGHDSCSWSHMRTHPALTASSPAASSALGSSLSAVREGRVRRPLAGAAVPQSALCPRGLRAARCRLVPCPQRGVPASPGAAWTANAAAAGAEATASASRKRCLSVARAARCSPVQIAQWRAKRRISHVGLRARCMREH